MRDRSQTRRLDRLAISDLTKGDCIEFHTSHSTYLFWVEFPDLSIGVAQGGIVPSPSRVRLVAEGLASWERPVRPIALGERAQIEILGPDGRVVRRYVTTAITSLELKRRATAAA